jgi:alkyl hydroperoxide reductase subunit AhpC
VATLLLANRTTPGAGDTSGTVQQTLTSPSLRTWLREGWAILFSHPDDFVRYDLEMDRWLVLTRRAFAQRGIRPIALASPKLDPERNWVTQVSGDNRTVLLEDPARQHFGPVDLQTPVLREEIEQPGRRFVMIIDSALRRQKIFTYDTLSNLPSPLEFLGWAEVLRSKQAEQLHGRPLPAAETNRTFVPATDSHPFFAARRHKHPIPQVACASVAQARAG